MSNTATDLQETVLRECAASTPQPWYPAAFAQAAGISRDTLDACLDQLRLAGLIQLTDWVAQHGQGYILTEHGEAVLHNQRQLTALRTGRPPAAPAPAAVSEERRMPLVRGDAVRAALMDEQKPVVTQWLLYANVGVFLVGLVLASQRQVNIIQYLSGARTQEVANIWHDTGALHAQDIVLHGDWWRLLSCCFVHLGGLHLAVNMYALYVLGPALERMFGRSRYLFLYLATGVCGSSTAILLQPETGLAGASGAICGLLGGVAVWVLLNKQYLPPSMVSGLMRNIVTNIILVTVISIPGLLGISVSWAGHLGGGLAGAAIAWPLNFSRFGRGAQRWLGLLGAVLVPLVVLLLLVQRLGSFQAENQGGDRAGPKENTVELTQEEMGLREKFLGGLNKLDEDVNRVHRDLAEGWLIKSKKELRQSKLEKRELEVPEDPVALMKAKDLCIRGKTEGVGLALAIHKTDIPTKRAEKDAVVAKKYAVACAEYFGLLGRLTDNTFPSEEVFSTIAAQWKEVGHLRGKLRKTIFWSDLK